MTFLAGREPRPLTAPSESPFQPVGLFLGQGAMGLEVAAYSAPRRPTAAELRELQVERTGRRATPVVAVVLWGDGNAAVCGPASTDLLVALEVEASQVERICSAALAITDRHSARRFLDQYLTQLDSPVPGLKNSSLFAMHELEVGVPQRSDWREAVRRAGPALALRGHALLGSLGFVIKTLPEAQRASVLIARDTKLAIALFLERPDEIEPPSPRFDNSSPISFALAKADQENLDYVVVLAGSTLRVYPVKPQVGTARRGRTETYVELNLDLLRVEQAGYLWLLCSAEALTTDASFTKILDSSRDYAASLGERLRDRVYEEVVPQLAKALVKVRRLRNPSSERLRETYEMALLTLFRLLFVAYAEDKELLPLHKNQAYTVHSLKEIAKRLQAAVQKGEAFEGEDFYWTEVSQLWKAIDKGNKGWGVPRYDGGLFATDEGASNASLRLAEITLADGDFGPPLAALLLERTDEGGQGPIDFRSLGVREFGTIYEGLLESELSVAETDLSVDPKTRAYLPVKGRAAVAVREGDIYLHNASGARKASGAYYTKEFAVEHLLDHALEPALDDHLARLGALNDERDAADRFFDFRIADIAMGSGHFLVAAVDHIERRLSNYLSKRHLPGVIDELSRLRQTAKDELGEEWVGEPIENTQLLRRQIARRCIFGVDLNPLSVELARLSVWIHTFVPGLPLSLLDHNLVVGNSLVGLGTLEEASELMSKAIDPRRLAGELFADPGVARLREAMKPLQQLARLSDASDKELREARKLYAEAKKLSRNEEALLTVLVASRVDADVASAVESGNVATRLGTLDDPEADRLVRKAAKTLEGLKPMHFPVAFPQVFLGERAGFDVIVGNPPWEEATVEEDAFWARHYPGMRSLPQREQELRKATLRRERPDLAAEYQQRVEEAERMRALLTAGAYPGMGTGDPDVYKAFCWRFWNLVAKDGGRIGVVLPRSALAAKGSTEFRLEVFKASRTIDVTMLLNNKTWVFPEVHPQYTIGLVSIVRGVVNDAPIALRGPYASFAKFSAGVVRDAAIFKSAAVLEWNDTASLPLLPAEGSASVFAKLRRAPRLDLDEPQSWRARPHTELHATNDKPWMDLRSKECPEGFWPVYKGESFDLWTPDTGTYYAWANPKKVLPYLHEKRLRSAGRIESPFAGFPKKWLDDSNTLPCLSPRIAFRDITRSTDSRTVRVALLPGEAFITNKGPYFLWPRGDERDQAFLLGVLSSLPLDWYARRFVEITLNYFILNPFPIPRPTTDNPLRSRVIDLAGRLAAQDHRFRAWARALSLKPHRLAEDEQSDLIAELDAAVARLYGLEEQDLVHIFQTFHEGWDYQDRLDHTLKHFHVLKRLA